MSPKVKIKLKCINGINYSDAISDILFEVSDVFDFEESLTDPDYIIFGPYGNDLPPKGNYTRIGYFCENIIPDLSVCEWAFGVPREEEINHPKYKRIQWHGLNPKALIKQIDDNDLDRIVCSKTKFCNFLYSHKVPYREEFFRQLSRYKKIDSPGKSMNNMSSIDSMYQGNIWERKKQFLSDYKFTIAFENYCYPGYQTEKLYDAMQCSSIPIYCGDPYIHEIFNTESFINTSDYIKIDQGKLLNLIERNAQFNFTDIRPMFFYQPQHRLQRKFKSLLRELKMFWQFNKLNFSPLIDKIIEIDTNPDLYIQMLKKAWFKDNNTPRKLSTKDRWLEIFSINDK
ncbi:glycosyltransferase family 10 domain-containing protein [Paradesertivirga mongoliensis]|uniref:Glycosyltransferase family 10 domain-containing protein n=1 Tax=Paradesertivirga mongoliensis TaxID=2100740 RepID=A0ABW4ZH62_9SPHI